MPIQARYFGPYTVKKMASDLNYNITTTDRRKQKQLCHINMLKEYADRDSSNVTPIKVIRSVPHTQSETNYEEVNCEEITKKNQIPLAQNSRILTLILNRNYHIWIKLKVMN